MTRSGHNFLLLSCTIVPLWCSLWCCSCTVAVHKDAVFVLTRLQKPLLLLVHKWDPTAKLSKLWEGYFVFELEVGFDLEVIMFYKHNKTVKQKLDSDLESFWGNLGGLKSKALAQSQGDLTNQIKSPLQMFQLNEKSWLVITWSSSC